MKDTAGKQRVLRLVLRTSLSYNEKIPGACAPGILLFGRYATPQRLELTGDLVCSALGDRDLGGNPDLLLAGNLCTEPVPVQPELPEPVVAVGVVGSVASKVRFMMADDILRLD